MFFFHSATLFLLKIFCQNVSLIFVLKKMKQSGVQIKNVFPEFDESVRVRGESSYE